jgi:DNA-binding HxlR family transcriptional regulator
MKIDLMARSQRPFCPVTEFQRIISGKYKLRILWDLKEGPLRFGAIRNGLLRRALGTDEISSRVLSRELKELTEMGMLTRKDFQVWPRKVEYSLTSKGKSLIPIISKMHDWGARHLAPPR